MNFSFVIVFTVTVLILLWIMVRGRGMHVHDMRSAEEAIVPVDLEAFRNLVDVQQDRFLCEHLASRDFRRVQRARSTAIAGYLRCLASNTSVMLRLGEAARAIPEPSIAAQGAELATAAVTLRVYCLLALVQAYAAFLFPGTGMSVGSVVDSYDRLTVKLWTIGRAWTPARNAS